MPDALSALERILQDTSVFRLTLLPGVKETPELQAFMEELEEKINQEAPRIITRALMDMEIGGRE